MNTTSQEMKLIVINGQVIETSAQFTPKIGKDIGYEKASKMVKRHIDANPDDVMAQFMGREIIEKILAQPNVIGIRSFHGLNNLGINQLVMVGVDADGNNVLDYNLITETGDMKTHKGIIAGDPRFCPPGCADGSDGNSWFKW
jgi:hypothetical protein